mgnify:FL=1
MIGSVLCSCRTISRVLTHTVIKAQEPLYHNVVNNFTKYLFPPATQISGASPHTPYYITFSALYQGHTIYL